MAFENDRPLEHLGAAATPAMVGPGLSDGMRTRILLADDDDNVRDLLRRLLALQGWDVVAARNGREAVDAWPEEGAPFDLVILDMNMPVMSGPAAYEELRRRHPGMVVLFISGYLEEASWRDVVLKGKVPFLAKPFTPQQLVATATALLAHARQRADLGLHGVRGLARAAASSVA
jgi:DNA-binding NtrC family response regulator